MENLLIVIAVAAAVYFIYKKVWGARLQVREDYFEQHGVKVHFLDKTITIRSHTYHVNQVTGIKSILGGSLKGVEIQVDDFKKPIHKISIGGFGKAQEKFAQRLSVALRKAGGPSFV
ncbi:hypothetical protein [Paraflavitalea pollutisoli]|uniref:hypothetical protein n=1 Tax=Paraflavitalea pollutisoli TaxID=3034143 RepID=UPI0023EADE27|nr:hypothetical protein [Paraflavitalea sp. H1-2-19X]